MHAKFWNYLTIRRCPDANNNIVDNALEFHLWSDVTLPFDDFKSQNLKVGELYGGIPL